MQLVKFFIFVNLNLAVWPLCDVGDVVNVDYALRSLSVAIGNLYWILTFNDLWTLYHVDCHMNSRFIILSRSMKIKVILTVLYTDFLSASFGHQGMEFNTSITFLLYIEYYNVLFYVILSILSNFSTSIAIVNILKSMFRRNFRNFALPKNRQWQVVIPKDILTRKVLSSSRLYNKSKRREVKHCFTVTSDRKVTLKRTRQDSLPIAKMSFRDFLESNATWYHVVLRAITAKTKILALRRWNRKSERLGNKRPKKKRALFFLLAVRYNRD